MRETDVLKQLTRYARVARNSQMLLVMEPPERSAPEVEEAREAIVEDANVFLMEVEEGVESPYFTTYTRKDARYIDLIAIERVRRSAWDRFGLFELSEPHLKVTDAVAAQTASFAYLAAICMQQLKVPFYQVPTLRTSVSAPRNLGEFIRTVSTVRDVTFQAKDVGFHKVVERNGWRIAFAFWEANKWLAQNISTGLAD